MGNIVAAFAMLIIALCEGVVDSIAWIYEKLRYG